MKPSVALATVGCKLNQYETQVIEEAFRQKGFEVVPFGTAADICIVNSCTVTGRSDYRSRQLVRRARRANPSSIVVMAGCYSQRDADSVLGMPEVDIAIGNIDRTRIPEIVSGFKSGTSPSVVSDFSEKPQFEKCAVEGLTDHTRAFIKIQDGCDENCTYCAVQGVRGPDRSRSFDETLSAVRQLLAGGFREIVLTGVHVGNYGSALSTGENLAALLRSICDTGELFRVRLSSMEPCTITDELVHLVASDERICNHFHVPLQSGDDRILKLMGRPYHSVQYAEIIGRIAGAIPDCGLGADVMVGFPTEDDDSFRATTDLIESLPLSYLHVFSYSPRPGTPASTMTGEPSGDEKKMRSAILRKIGRDKAKEFRSRHVGRVVQVLSEGKARHMDCARGYTSNYIRVYFDDDAIGENEFADVEAQSVFMDGLKGTVAQ